MRRHVFVSASALAVVGCSLLIDTNGLDTHDGPPADGGSPRETSTDAGVATNDADTGTTAFCAGRVAATFCEDFSGSAVDEKMVMTIEQNAGSAEGTLDTSVFLSPPGSLHVRVRGQEQTASGDVKEPKFFLTKHVEGTVGGVTCEFAILARAADGDFTIAGFRLTEGQQANVEGGYFSTYFADPTTFRAPLGSLVSTPPSWRRYRFGVEPTSQASGPNAGKRRVWIDQVEVGGQAAAKNILEFFVPYDTPQPSLDLTIGGSGYAPVDLDYNLDDFACTVTAP